MKNVRIAILPACLLILVFTPKIMARSKNDFPSPFEYSLTESAQGSQAELYQRAKDWIIKTLGTASEPITFQDSEAGTIKAKGYFFYPQRSFMGNVYGFNIINYTLSLNVQNNIYQCRITDLKQEADQDYDIHGKTYGTLDAYSAPRVHGFDANIHFSQSLKWYKIKRTAQVRCNDLLMSLKDYMSNISFVQNSISSANHNFPTPFEFTLTDSVRGTEAELYIKADDWITATFNDKNDKILLKDKGAGKIIARSFLFHPEKGILGNTWGYDKIHYKLAITVHNNQYRCAIYDFKQEGAITGMDINPGTYGSLNAKKIPKEMWFNQDKAWNKIKNSAAREANELMKSLQKHMHGNGG